MLMLLIVLSLFSSFLSSIVQCDYGEKIVCTYNMISKCKCVHRLVKGPFAKQQACNDYTRATCMTNVDGVACYCARN